jgi:hypothetical protein
VLTELDRGLASGDMPEALRDVLLPFPWELERLRSLRLRQTRIEVASFEWMLVLPLWRHEDAWFSVSPRHVLGDPARYVEQWHRTMRADLAWPVHTTERAGRLVIVDGVHRLALAVLRGDRLHPALHLPRRIWSSIASAVWEQGGPRLGDVGPVGTRPA